MNITFYLKKILVKLYLRKTIMGKMNILDPITPLPASDDFFHLIVDPYKSRFFSPSLPGIRNYCSSNLLFVLNLRKKGRFYKVFYILTKKNNTGLKIFFICIENQESLRESTSVIFCLNFGG